MIYYDYRSNQDCDDITDNPRTECQPAYDVNIILKRSDAFILEESAINGPGMNYIPKIMDGSNHLQMRNDSKMKDAVEAIFIDGLGGSYFKTEAR